LDSDGRDGMERGRKMSDYFDYSEDGVYGEVERDLYVMGVFDSAKEFKIKNAIAAEVKKQIANSVAAYDCKKATRGAISCVDCAQCKANFKARVADINRGWGKFCSKSCKAIHQEQARKWKGEEK